MLSVFIIVSLSVIRKTRWWFGDFFTPGQLFLCIKLCISVWCCSWSHSSEYLWEQRRNTTFWNPRLVCRANSKKFLLSMSVSNYSSFINNVCGQGGVVSFAYFPFLFSGQNELRNSSGPAIMVTIKLITFVETFSL